MLCRQRHGVDGFPVNQQPRLELPPGVINHGPGSIVDPGSLVRLFEENRLLLSHVLYYSVQPSDTGTPLGSASSTTFLPRFCPRAGALTYINESPEGSQSS